MARNFIDISSHQSSIRIREVPTDALIVKATEGRGWRDKSMPGFIAQARAADKPVGFYHYVSQGNTPQSEADNLLAYTQGHRRDNDLLCLDWEPIGNNPGNRNVDWARRFLEHLTGRVGNPVWTYMNLSTANASNWKPVTERWPLLWLAHYPGNNKATGYNPAGSRGHLDGGNRWQLAAWQFTDGGRLPGFGGNLDLNELYMPWWENVPAGSGTNPVVVKVPEIPPIRENDPAVHMFHHHGGQLFTSRGAPRLGCVCMALTFPLIEREMIRRGLIKHQIDVFQTGYNKGGVAASAGTHDMGGVIDVAQGITLDQRKVWAIFGVMMFPRTRQYGWTTGDHGHGVWHGCPHQTGSADRQVTSGMNGFDGLVGNARRNFEAPKRPWQDAYREHAAITITPSTQEDPVPELHDVRTTFDHAGPSEDNPDGYTLIRDGRGDLVPAVPIAARYVASAQIHAPTGVKIKTRYVYFHDGEWHRHMEEIAPKTDEGHPTHVGARRTGDCPDVLFLDVGASEACQVTVEQQATYWPK